MALGGGAQRNTEVVSIGMGGSLGTVGAQMGFEINEPATLVVADCLIKTFLDKSLRKGEKRLFN